jgi:hypothetical protein
MPLLTTFPSFLTQIEVTNKNRATLWLSKFKYSSSTEVFTKYNKKKFLKEIIRLLS